MAEPSPDHLPAVAAGSPHHDPSGQESEHITSPVPPFAPVFTLVDNSTTQTTHHPHVRYIFSDDDPDALTQALAECRAREDTANPDAPSTDRAIILDLARDDHGKYTVAWASSLSPSWAVLDAQLSRISPPSSEGEGSSGKNVEGDVPAGGRADQLMLRIEGIESGAMGSSGDLGFSSDGSKPASGTTSGAGSTQDKTRPEAEEYSALVGEFEKRQATLRKVVQAGEERRRKIGVDHPTDTGDGPEQEETRETSDTRKRASQGSNR